MGSYKCDGDGKTIVHNNQVFTPDGTAKWNCGEPESGSTVAFLPPADTIIQWGKAALGLA